MLKNHSVDAALGKPLSSASGSRNSKSSQVVLDAPDADQAGKSAGGCC
jgi:hypothetical protein